MENKNREKLLLVITAGCLGLMIFNWLIIQPLTAGWHRRSDRIDALRAKIADGQSTLRRADFIRARWDGMRTNALATVPTVAERQLFDAFDRWVRASGVTEGAFKPQMKETDENYNIMECRADVTGDARAIGKFLDQLAADPLGVRVSSLELTSRDDNGQQLSLGVGLDGLLLPSPGQ